LGYLPEAVLNYLSNLVWYHPENKEIYNIEEFIRLFEMEKINSSGARFNLDKLDWMNGEYIRQMSDDQLYQRVVQFIGNAYDEAIVKRTIPLVKERMKKLSDYVPLCEFLFKQPEKYEVDLIAKKELLSKIAEKLSSMEEWHAQTIGDTMLKTAQETGVKNSEYFMLLRVAISGKKISPPLNESMELLGQEECIQRIKNAVA
jgi:glutamyl-tRNA synthetase